MSKRLGPSLTLALAVACGETPVPTPVVNEDVGVMAYVQDGIGYCPVGASRALVFIRMDDENSTHCSTATGDRGEPAWLLPATPKTEPTCDLRRDTTQLTMCKVSGQGFQSLTADPARSEQFYAVLKLGDRCPGGSDEVFRRIDNEDDTNKNSYSGPIYPNEVVTRPLGSYTRLFFCVFRSAPSEAEVMPSFPELGFPYAVFHDFDGPQPSWVLSKRWLYTDDENIGLDQEMLYGPEGMMDVLTDFMKIVEEANTNTYFDIARVR